MVESRETVSNAAPSAGAPWFVRHFAITLYTWFFLGMALCGLLVPPERVAVLERSPTRRSVFPHKTFGM